MERLLAGGEQAPLDYTIFSVVISTLCLVLVVELIRHGLDIAASRKPFFQTILKMTYQELTTLGIVEFFIYLLHNHYKGFNFALEAVFVDVHFMLCYTALFNAMQCALVRIITSHRTDKAWVETEDIDVSHYNVIRREFDRVESEWRQLNYLKGGPPTQDTSVRPSSCISSLANIQDTEGLSVTDSFQRYICDAYTKLRHPWLYWQRCRLLVQVSYHDLRSHFIEQNELSSKFKVSQYLKRSLTCVLMDFIHISSSTWILLMVASIMLYYISGIILYYSKDEVTVWEFLAYLLASLIVAFLVSSFAIFFKMKKIFSKVMVMKLTIPDDKNMKKSSRGHGRTRTKSIDQLSLFWGGSPHAIIVATQLIQFGYALGLAAIFTYWNKFTYDKDSILMGLFVSYSVFLYLLADILPRFALCTSLGHLVNKERLHETMAEIKLNEKLHKSETVKKISDDSRGLEDTDLPTFFEGRKYKLLSLLPVMACAFLIAMRVEDSNIQSGILVDHHNTYQLRLVTCFWLETMIYCFMLIEMCVALSVFARRHNYEGVIASSIGLLLNIACLLLLLAAETKRCCSDDQNEHALRLLASVDHEDSATEDTDHNMVAEDSEGTFGGRTYGGLGNIEPYTFLICLSPFRFIAAGMIARLCGLDTDTEAPHKPHASHGPSPDEVREIWLSTIGQHSDVAKRYGPFSVELLQCMLGLTDVRNKPSVHHDNFDVSSGAETFRATEREFAFPESKLIQKMRRCEMRLEPLIDEWILVDAVLTKYELVLLEVPGDKNNLARQVTGSTGAVCLDDGGGGGLRLNVVAEGRKVASKFLLEDIDSICIEHSISTSGGMEMQFIQNSCRQLQEFWQESSVTEAYDANVVSRRWRTVDEDRLNITSASTRLYLRFLADLQEKEAGKNHVASHGKSQSLLANVGTETKLWCSTIASLLQPRFGDEDLEELIKLTQRITGRSAMSSVSSVTSKKDWCRQVKTHANAAQQHPPPQQYPTQQPYQPPNPQSHYQTPPPQQCNQQQYQGPRGGRGYGGRGGDSGRRGGQGGGNRGNYQSNRPMYQGTVCQQYPGQARFGPDNTDSQTPSPVAVNEVPMRVPTPQLEFERRLAENPIVSAGAFGGSRPTAQFFRPSTPLTMESSSDPLPPAASFAPRPTSPTPRVQARSGVSDNIYAGAGSAASSNIYAGVGSASRFASQSPSVPSPSVYEEPVQVPTPQLEFERRKAENPIVPAGDFGGSKPTANFFRKTTAPSPPPRQFDNGGRREDDIQSKWQNLDEAEKKNRVAAEAYKAFEKQLPDRRCQEQKPKQGLGGGGGSGGAGRGAENVNLARSIQNERTGGIGRGTLAENPARSTIKNKKEEQLILERKKHQEMVAQAAREQQQKDAASTQQASEDKSPSRSQEKMQRAEAPVNIDRNQTTKEMRRFAAEASTKCTKKAENASMELKRQNQMKAEAIKREQSERRAREEAILWQRQEEEKRRKAMEEKTQAARVKAEREAAEKQKLIDDLKSKKVSEAKAKAEEQKLLMEKQRRKVAEAKERERQKQKLETDARAKVEDKDRARVEKQSQQAMREQLEADARARAIEEKIQLEEKKMAKAGARKNVNIASISNQVTWNTRPAEGFQQTAQTRVAQKPKVQQPGPSKSLRDLADSGKRPRVPVGTAGNDAAEYKVVVLKEGSKSELKGPLKDLLGSPKDY